MIRVEKELLASKSTDDNENRKPSFVSRSYVKEVLKIKAESFTNKPLHGYVRKKIKNNEYVYEKLTDQWSNNKYISNRNLIQKTPYIKENSKITNNLLIRTNAVSVKFT